MACAGQDFLAVLVAVFLAADVLRAGALVALVAVFLADDFLAAAVPIARAFVVFLTGAFFTAVLVAVFLGNGGEITPTGYDGAIGPALLTGAAAVAIAAVASLFAPGRKAVERS